MRILRTVENVLVGLLLVATVLTILAQVFFRYVLAQPLSWSTEVATGLLLYIAFIGFAIGVRDNAHVALNLFERRLGPRGRRAARILELVALGAVLLVIGIGAVLYMGEQRDVTTSAGLPLWTILLAIPLGAALGCVHAIAKIAAVRRGAEPDPMLVGGSA